MCLHRDRVLNPSDERPPSYGTKIGIARLVPLDPVTVRGRLPIRISNFGIDDMTKFISGVSGLVVSLVLFSGFSIVNLLSEERSRSHVGDAGVAFFAARKAELYAGIVLLFVAQQVLLRWPKPAAPSDVEAMRITIDPILEAVLNDYYQTIQPLNQAQPTVRTNIMLPTWRSLRLGRYMKIYYWNGGPAGVIYPEAELDLQWSPRSGTCGYAWAKRRPVIYDSGNEDFGAPETRLSSKQRRVVGHIGSVLSVAVWSKARKEVVGILNLDSTSNVDQTFFNRQEVVERVEARARALSTVLFPDGVKAN